MGFGTPPVKKHTELTDKEVAGIIDHADASVTDEKLASGVGLADTQICKLPTAIPNQILKRGPAAPPENPWDDYIYWLTFFESLSGYYASGGVSLNETNLQLLTTGVANNYQEFYNSRTTSLGCICLRWKHGSVQCWSHGTEQNRI
jgi:hypothetical protein